MTFVALRCLSVMIFVVLLRLVRGFVHQAAYVLIQNQWCLNRVCIIMADLLT